jgi:hypothetical protein
MTTAALVFAGDQDELPLSVRGPDWMTDPYFLSPSSKSLLTVFGAEHSLGGIAGYEARETTDENPERVALIQWATWAYLRHALGIEDASWSAMQMNLPNCANPTGPNRIQVKH